jgi:hypothetical protein
LNNFKIDDDTLCVYFIGSVPFTPYCRDITKGKNVGIRTFMSGKKNLFLDFYFNMIIKKPMEPGSDVNKVESIFLEEKNVIVFVTCIW